MGEVKTIIKPIVHYNLDERRHIMVGMGAIVHPIDHPSPLVSNKEVCQTSRVLNIDGDEFETRNTIYKGVHVDGDYGIFC